MSTETFAGSHLSFSAAEPATLDQAGYEALTWTQDDCSSENIPPISRSFASVDVSTVCSLTNKQKKGTATYDPLSFTMLSDWANTAQIILETAEASTSSIISVKIEFASGNVVYLTAVVAMFALTDGGTGDDLNKRSVELWIQSDEIVKVAA